MTFATRDGLDVYYQSHGEGPALVLIHGSGGNHASWWQQLPQLRASHRVITLDLPGFGASPAGPERWDMDGYVRDVVAVLDDASVQRAVLVGQALGGALAARLAVEHPQRVAGVVLAHSTGAIDDAQLVQMLREDRAQAEQLPVAERLMGAEFAAASPELVFLFMQLGTFNRARLADIRNAGEPGPTGHELATSGVPVCFLTGADDAVIRPATVSRAQQLVAGSTLELVAGAPHAMYWAAPGRFNDAVARFLNTVHHWA